MESVFFKNAKVLTKKREKRQTRECCVDEFNSLRSREAFFLYSDNKI